MVAMTRSQMIVGLVGCAGAIGAFAAYAIAPFPIPEFSLVQVDAEGVVIREIAGGWMLGGVTALLASFMILIAGSVASAQKQDAPRSAVGESQKLAMMQEFGKKLDGSLQAIVDILCQGLETSGKFVATLSAAERKLSLATDPAAIKAAVKVLIAENAATKTEVSALNERLANARTEVEQLREQLEDARNESFTDGLTGLKNRKWFDSRLAAEIEDAQRSSRPLCLVLLDIDHFKSVNDNFGHQTGDKILSWYGRKLLDNIKGVDSAARYGGEEFAVILPDTRLSAAAGLMDQIRTKVEKVQWTHKGSGRVIGKVTASFGVTQFRRGDSASDLIERADTNLYAAKAAGRNRVTAK
ncbi:MAG: diguanylate cyclase [Pseudomonadota bacterium]